MMAHFSNIYLPCPYGEGQYSTHKTPPPDSFPCSGIYPGKVHDIELGDWLLWLTGEGVKLSEHVEREVERVSEDVYALIRGEYE